MGDSKQGKKILTLALMIVLTFGAQLLGVVKTSAVAGIFGASGTMDAFNFANSVVMFLFGFVSAAIPTVVMPSYVDKSKDKRVVNTFITIVYGIVFLIVLLLAVFRYPVIGLLSDRGEGHQDLVCNILLILLFAQSLASMNHITVAFFQCEGKYNIPKIINFVTQLLVIVILLYCKELAIMEYTLLVAGGIILGFVVDLAVALRMGWRYRPAFTIRDSETLKLVKAFLPVVFSTGVYHLSLMIDSLIAENLEVGMITILTYSTHLASMVNVVISGNLLTYIYPRIIKNIKEKKPQALFWRQSQGIHAIACLIAAGFLVVGREFVGILFQRGAFSPQAADVVFVGAAIYISGQQFGVLRDVLYKYFYANGDTKIPAQNSVIVSISNIVISLALIQWIGYYGIIIGTTCASLISLAVIMIRFKGKYGCEIPVKIILGRYLCNFAIAGVSVGIVLLTKQLLPIENDVLSLLVFGVETVGVYAGIQFVFNRKILEAFRTL